MTAAGESRGASARYTALDGLRGIAALVVVIHHSLLIIGVLASPYFTGRAAATGTLAWWLTNTPLHLIWEGTGAVYVFFVLSGFVLTLPALGGGYDWIAYYPQRLIRLYLPVVGAVVFAAATLFIIPRTSTVSSDWLRAHPLLASRSGFLLDITLLPGAGYFASPLWSLTWEVLFSLLLPFIVWCALRVRRVHWPIFIVAVLAVAVGGARGTPWLAYMPMFLVGVLIAMNRESIRRRAASFTNATWIVLTVVAVIGFTARWLLMPFALPGRFMGALTAVALLSAAFFVVMALYWKGARRGFESRPLRTLGRLSFSLYLVHEPIIVAAGFAFPDQPWVAIPVALAVVAIITPLFFLFVERPSHRLAVKVGRAVRARRARRIAKRDPEPDVSATA